MEGPPPAPDRKEILARQLQHRLQQRRSRPLLAMIVGLIVLAGGLVGIWSMSHPTPELPQLLLACGDTVCAVGERPQCWAMLEAPGIPNAPLAGVKLTWTISEPLQSHEVKSEPTGCVLFDLPVQEKTGHFDLRVSYVEPREKYRRDAASRVFVWPAELKEFHLRVHGIEELMAQDDAVDWLRTGPATPPRLPTFDIKTPTTRFVTVIATGDVKPGVYRTMRDWVGRINVEGANTLPPPVLHGQVNDVAEALRAKFGADNVFVHRPNAAKP